MHLKKSNYFKFCFSLAIISLLMLINAVCTSIEETETVFYTASGKKAPKESLGEGSGREVYHLNVSYYDMLLSANRQLSITEQGRSTYTIPVFKDTSLSLRAVEYCIFKKDLILICQRKEGGEEWSEIMRINLAKKKVQWRIRFGSFNLSSAAVQGRYLYGSTIGYICKIDLKNGKIVWDQDDLWEKYKVNYFSKIIIYKDTVGFIGKVYTLSDEKTMTGKTATFKYNKRSGEEIIQ